MKQYAFSLFLVALILGLSFEPTAQAIPAGQRDCDTISAGITLGLSGFVAPGQFEIVPNTSVTVNNGTVARNCIITFSTEVQTSFNDLTVLGYTIDSPNPANCQVIGPDSFHVGAINPFETATHMGVKTIGAGTHTIRLCFLAGDLNANGSATTNFWFRCLAVECRTQ